MAMMQSFLKLGSKGTTPGLTKEGPKPKPSTAPEKPPRKHAPWVERYRPNKMEDVAYQDEVVAVLKKAIQKDDLPNLLFYGPPGTGKTSTILAASKELFGDIWRQRVLELNASDERGISVVRDKVKNFSQLSASGRRPDGKPCPPFKIVILDEADSMTKDAQSALRRTMEKQSKTTRFCLICNYVSRIIEPITSRCAKFRFKPLSNEILEGRLREISKKEELEVQDEAIAALLETSEGDMRKAITYLQSVARLKAGEAVTGEDVREIAGVIPKPVLEKVLKACRSNSYEKIEKTVKNMMAEGYSASQLINQMHDDLVVMETITDRQKSAIMERVAVVDKCLMDGADEYLQIMDLCTVIMHQMCNAES